MPSRPSLWPKGCHLWVLEPIDSGCRLVTEEVQRGLLPSIGRVYLRHGLHTWHDRWLAGIAERAGRSIERG